MITQVMGGLRVLSWNVFNENPDARRIDACLDAVAPDVALLQEALQPHLDAVRRRFEHVATALDYICKAEPCYLAIASRPELRSLSVIKHFPMTKPPGSLFARLVQWVEFLETISADVPISEDGVVARFVLAHTSSAVGPSVRQEELAATAAAHIPDQCPCVFAGDFNSFAAPWNAPLLALPLAYRAADFPWRERRRLDAWFDARGFFPAVRGATYPRFGLQMDQVYLRGLAVRSAAIIRESWGSDHRPIVVEVEACRSSDLRGTERCR